MQNGRRKKRKKENIKNNRNDVEKGKKTEYFI